MQLPTATLVIPVVLALAGAGISGAVLTGNVPFLARSPDLMPPPSAAGVEGMEVLETFSGVVDDDVLTGTLDLRTFRGNIHLVGAPGRAYEITVYQTPAGDGQRLGDGAVEARFEEDRSEGIGLHLIVERTGTVDVGLNQGYQHFAVVATVPADIDWTMAFLCSGSSSGLGSTVRQAVLGAIGRDHEGPTCVEGSGGLNLNLNLPTPGGAGSEEEAPGVPFAVHNLRGGELGILAQYADLELMGVTFAKADVMTQYGNIHGMLDAQELSVLTQYGEVMLQTAVDNLEVMSQYGSLHVQVTGGGSGEYGLHSQYGDVMLLVPRGPDRGYDVEAMTQYGEVDIALQDAETEHEGEDDDTALRAAPAAGVTTRGLLGLPTPGGFPKPPMPPVPGMPFGDRERHEGSTATARTYDFDDRAIQVTIEAMTQYGDVLVTDLTPEEMEAEVAGEDEERKERPRHEPSAGHREKHTEAKAKEGVSNERDHFRFGTDTHDRDGNARFEWENTADGAELKWGADGKGAFILTVLDGAGAEVYRAAYEGGRQSEEQAVDGAAGKWVIEIAFDGFSGRMGVQADAA